MLTAKGKYGLKALAHLGALRPGETTQTTEIANANNIPKKFLEAILRELRTANYVFSKKGPEGGFMLARAPSEITVGDVIRKIDGPFAPIPCASRSAYRPCEDCDDVTTCNIRLAMSRCYDAMSEILDGMTIADLIARHHG
jgi:Rrf2 family protein